MRLEGFPRFFWHSCNVRHQTRARGALPARNLYMVPVQIERKNVLIDYVIFIKWIQSKYANIPESGSAKWNESGWRGSSAIWISQPRIDFILDGSNLKSERSDLLKICMYVLIFGTNCKIIFNRWGDSYPVNDLAV